MTCVYSSPSTGSKSMGLWGHKPEYASSTWSSVSPDLANASFNRPSLAIWPTLCLSASRMLSDPSRYHSEAKKVWPPGRRILAHSLSAGSVSCTLSKPKNEETVDNAAFLKHRCLASVTMSVSLL